MVERSELITVCRQIGGMMEAGVDILRVTRVLRAQTENPRLLELYDALDHDLKMGRSLADAVERAPDVFSPFAVSLVQQGEEANDLAGAFLKFADFLQQEEASAQQGAAQQGAAQGEAFSLGSSANVPVAERPGDQHDGHIQSDGRATAHALPQVALNALIERLQRAGVRALIWLSWLLLCLAVVCAVAEAGWLQRRWLSVALPAVAALFLAATAVWLRRGIRTEQQAEEPVEFQAHAGSNDDETAEAAGGAAREVASGAAGQTMAAESRRSVERRDVPDDAAPDDIAPGGNNSRNNRIAVRPASSRSEEDYE